MEDFNHTSWESSSNYSNMSYSNGSSHIFYIMHRVNWILIGIGLPLTLVVMIAVFTQVKKDQGAPLFIINLLFSDLIQFIFRIPLKIKEDSLSNTICVNALGVAVSISVGFMICISCERYLVIANPLWYRFRRSIKTSVVVCVVVWVLPVFVYSVIVLWSGKDEIISPVFAAFLVLPFPFFIFFLVGTIRALSGALSVPADEKRRIVTVQVVVLLIYALLFLPVIFFLISEGQNDFVYFGYFICIYLSPFADTTLYLLIRKSILDKFLALLCPCKISIKT